MLHFLAFCSSFLLAQAIIFEAAVPLFIPFYIAATRYERSFTQTILVGGLLGASTLGIGHVLQLVLQLVIFKFLNAYIIKGYPLVALLAATTFVHLVWQLVFYSFHVPPLVFLYVIFEIAATGIMYVFYKQLLVEPNKLLIDWRYERMISGIVVVSLLLVSLTPLQFFNIAPATVLLQFLICCAAYYGSISFAAFVATLMSVTISLTQLSFSGMIALYAVTGVVVGNAKKLGKFGIAILSIVPSALFYVYDATLPLDIVHFISISLGALLFLQVTAFVTVTREEVVPTVNVVEQSVHDFKRFNIFLQQMVQLSISGTLQQRLELTDFTVCQNCYRYERCWSQPYMEIKLKELLKAKQYKSEAAHLKAEQAIADSCIRAVFLQQELQHRFTEWNIANQQYYSRKLIGQQLQQMGEHFDRLLEHANKIGNEKHEAEHRLAKYLGSTCVQVELQKIRSGYITGSINIVEEVKLEQLEDQLSQFFEEQIMITNQQPVFAIIETMKYTFRSAIRYEMQYDIYNKSNADVSGDHVVVTEIERGLQTILVADGMGTGKIAREQSQQLIFLLRQCMQYQLSPQLALLSLQYLLNPLSHDSYSTLDMLLFDLKNGKMIAWKTGAMATYIVRGEKIIVVESRHAPIGTLQQSTSAETVQLLAGDFVFILTDGMFESDLYDVQERFLQQQLLATTREDLPLSTVLYEVVERYKTQFSIEDDVTLIAVKIEHLQHRWTTAKYRAK